MGSNDAHKFTVWADKGPIREKCRFYAQLQRAPTGTPLNTSQQEVVTALNQGKRAPEAVDLTNPQLQDEKVTVGSSERWESALPEDLTNLILQHALWDCEAKRKLLPDPRLECYYKLGKFSEGKPFMTIRLENRHFPEVDGDYVERKYAAGMSTGLPVYWKHKFFHGLSSDDAAKERSCYFVKYLCANDRRKPYRKCYLIAEKIQYVPYNRETEKQSYFEELPRWCLCSVSASGTFSEVYWARQGVTIDDLKSGADCGWRRRDF